MRATLSFYVLALSVAGTAQTLDKPDFSGQWALVNPVDADSNVARALTVRQSIVTTTARGTPMRPFFSELNVERRFESGVVSESYQIGIGGGTVPGLAAVGDPSPAPTQELPWTRHSVVWDENRLVIKTGRYSRPTTESGSYAEHQEVWSLDPERRLLITVTHRSSGSQPRTSTLLYERR